MTFLLKSKPKIISFLVLPAGCHDIIGPFSLQCLTSSWLQAGCSLDGNKAPDKLPERDFAVLSNHQLL